MTPDTVDDRYMLSVDLNDEFLFTVPSQVREEITRGTDDDRRIAWYAENTQDIMVIADGLLEEPNFEPANQILYSMYGDQAARTKIPEEFIGEYVETDDDGNPEHDVLYLFTTDDMVTGDTKSAYVLSEPKAWDLLPNPHPDSIDQGLADQVLAQAPGFLPTPE